MALSRSVCIQGSIPNRFIHRSTHRATDSGRTTGSTSSGSVCPGCRVSQQQRSLVTTTTTTTSSIGAGLLPASMRLRLPPSQQLRGGEGGLAGQGLRRLSTGGAGGGGGAKPPPQGPGSKASHILHQGAFVWLVDCVWWLGLIEMGWGMLVENLTISCDYVLLIPPSPLSII